MPFHHSFQRNPRRRPGADLEALRDVVSAKVFTAMKLAHESLERLGVPHALVGGLAVGVHGYPRATKDVDFLVSDAAFDFHGPIVSTKQGLPINVGGVAVDLVSIAPDEGFLTSTLAVSEPLTVVPLEALVYMKLKANRPGDRRDVVELARLAEDPDAVTEYLAEHAPDRLSLWYKLLAEANSDE